MDNFTMMWWRDGFNRGSKQMCFQTTNYGMVFNNETGNLCRLGYIAHKYSEKEVSVQNDAVCDALPTISTALYNNGVPAQSPVAFDSWGAHSRILELGHNVCRMDVMFYPFEGQDINGRLELMALPHYLNIDYSLFSHDDGTECLPEIRFDLTGYTLAFDSNEAVGFNGKDGGLVFVKRNADFRYSGSTLYISRAITLPKDKFTGFNISIIPCKSASPAVAAPVIAINSVKVTGGESSLDASRGLITFDTNNTSDISQEDFVKEEARRYCERLPFSIENPTDYDLLVPVRFCKDGTAATPLSSESQSQRGRLRTFPVTGLCPMLRTKNGEPTGIQVQLSKNWHHCSSTNPDDLFYAPLNHPKRFWEGPWLHAYALLSIPAHTAFNAEYLCTFASWGNVWAASHSQLCLAGWGGNYQLWESSAIGSFGEAFCYDAEISHGRAFIDDIRPLTVYPRNDKTKPMYNWTGCNGGGNFLVYENDKKHNVPLKRIRVWFKQQGPNLTNVIYTGVTDDNAIRCTYTAQLPRTDDCSRALHSFKYEFDKDVAFSRFVMYQLGADHYNDNCYPRTSIGNNDGPVNVFGTVDGEFVPPTSSTPGYPDGKMQRCEIPGEGLYIASLGASFTDTNFCKNGPIANRTLVLRAFDATVNGKKLNKPAINLYCTDDFDVPCTAVELTLPEYCGDVIKAGSVITGTVEYINLPLKKEYYYGTSKVLMGYDDAWFDTWHLAHHYLTKGTVNASAKTGSVESHYPVRITADNNAAEFTISGGLSYVPVTITNLSTQYGFVLEKKQGNTWVGLGQEVLGNDYWQVYANPDGTYELTYNVEHNGDEHTYRLRSIK